MPNGEFLMAGGIRIPALNAPAEPPHLPAHGNHGLNYTYIFNPNPQIPGQEWRVAGGVDSPHAMADDRYYPTLTQLGKTQGFSGKIVVMSGWIDGGVVPPTFALKPQYYDETDGWHYFQYLGSEQPFSGPYDYYPSAHLIPAGNNVGKIFYSIPMIQSYMFNPFWEGFTPPGYWAPVGTERTLYRLNGTSTMLPLLPPYNTMTARVIIIGGAASYDEDVNAVKSAEVIDIASASPQWESLGDLLFFARKNHISVMLPNDMLFVVGGNLRAYGLDPEYSAELIDTTQADLQSTMLPAHVYPREHHCIALLLPDATVFLAGGGGGIPGDEVYHIEIYEPGYLFEGTRPEILSPLTDITYGSQFTIQTSLPIAASPNGIRLIRFGAVTHSTDMSQLSVGLSYTAGPSNTYTVTAPPDANVAPPGLYMLFVLRPKAASLSQETMIPSVAKIVKLSLS